jgi:nitroreductase
MKETLMQAFTFRHACKKFNENRKVAKEDLDFILEAGRLSPSSFGVEHWRFIVVESADLKKKLQTACHNQPQLSTCSHVIAIAALLEDKLAPNSSYIKQMFERWGMPEEGLRGVLWFYETMVNQYDIRWWSMAQCHIAAANMMTAAAVLGIDSCPIAGFDAAQVRRVLGLDEKKQEIALVVALGYRAKEPRPKTRLPMTELVEYR